MAAKIQRMIEGANYLFISGLTVQKTVNSVNVMTEFT
jgi:hypothetical protein